MDEKNNQALDAKFTEIKEPQPFHWLWLALGLVIGLLPGVAAILFFLFMPRPSPSILSPEYGKDIAALRSQLSQMELRLSSLPPPPDIKGFEQRLEEIKENAVDLAPIEDRMSKIEEQISKTQEAQEKTREEIVALNAAPKPVPQDLALGLALLQWRWNLERGLPFPSSLASVEKFTGTHRDAVQPLLEKGKEIAQTGAPTLLQLQQNFPVKEIAIAINAAPLLQSGEDASSLWSRIWQRLSQVIVIRKEIPEEEPAGENALDTLARAEQAIKAGDLKTAFLAIQPLPSDAARKWEKQAQNRLIADTLAQEIDRLMAELVTY